jgi:hypothetical protein
MERSQLLLTFDALDMSEQAQSDESRWVIADLRPEGRKFEVPELTDTTPIGRYVRGAARPERCGRKNSTSEDVHCVDATAFRMISNEHTGPIRGFLDSKKCGLNNPPDMRD